MNDNLSSRMILPMSEYSFVEPGKKWLMRVSTNNQAMRVDILLVTSAMDFEVEEIVCGGKSWGARPKEAFESDQNIGEREHARDVLNQSRYLKYLASWKVKKFTPPDLERAIVPRGFDQLVIVVSNRGVFPTEIAPSLESPKICAAALGDAMNSSEGSWGEEEAAWLVPRWNPSERQIEEYLDRIRRPRGGGMGASP